MATSRFTRTRIGGLVAVIPPVERSIDEEAADYGGNAAQLERIKKTIGLHRRRVVEPGVTTADLCEHAARELLRRGGPPAAEVDAVVCVTQTPDHFQPCNAALLHGRLGLGTQCAALDVNLGCSGFVYGLWLAFFMVESGAARQALVLAGDTVSRQTHPRDRAVRPLFGDGGSAAWVTRAGGETPAFFSLHTDGTGWRHLIVPAGAFRQPADEAARAEVTDADGNTRAATNLFMDGAEVFNFSLKVGPAAIRELAALAGRPLEDLDYVFFHQANRYILSNIARRLKLPPEKAPSGIVEKYGNQSSASIPVAVCDTLEAGPPGGPLTVALSGFGVGLSWASAWLTLDRLACHAVVDFPALKTPPPA